MYERTYNLEKAGRVCIKVDAGKDTIQTCKTVDALSVIQLPVATKPSPQLVDTTQGQGTASRSSTIASMAASIGSSSSPSSVSITMFPPVGQPPSAVVYSHQSGKKSLPFIGKLPNLRRAAKSRKAVTEVPPVPPSPQLLLQQPPLPLLPAEMERHRDSTELDKLVAQAAAESVGTVKEKVAVCSQVAAAWNAGAYNVPPPIYNVPPPMPGVWPTWGNTWTPDGMLIADQTNVFSDPTVSSSWNNAFPDPSVSSAWNNSWIAQGMLNSEGNKPEDSLDSFLSIGDPTTSTHRSLPWFTAVKPAVTIVDTLVQAQPIKLSRKVKTVYSLAEVPIPAVTSSSSSIVSPLITTVTMEHPLAQIVPVTEVSSVYSVVATCQNMPPEMRLKFNTAEETSKLNSTTVDSQLAVIDMEVDHAVVNTNIIQEVYGLTPCSSTPIQEQNDGQDTNTTKEVDRLTPGSSTPIQNQKDSQVIPTLREDKLVNNAVSYLQQLVGIKDHKKYAKPSCEVGSEEPSVANTVGTDISSSLNTSSQLSEACDNVSTVVKETNCLHTELSPAEQALREAKGKCLEINNEVDIDQLNDALANFFETSSVDVGMSEAAEPECRQKTLPIDDVKSAVIAATQEVQAEINTFYLEIEKCEVIETEIKTETEITIKPSPMKQTINTDVQIVGSESEIQSDVINTNNFDLPREKPLFPFSGQEQDVISEKFPSETKLSLDNLNINYESEVTPETVLKIVKADGEYMCDTSTIAADTNKDETHSLNLMIVDASGDCVELKGNNKTVLLPLAAATIPLAAATNFVSSQVNKLIDGIGSADTGRLNVEEMCVVEREKTFAENDCKINAADLMEYDNVSPAQNDNFVSVSDGSDIQFNIECNVAATNMTSSGIDVAESKREIVADDENKWDENTRYVSHAEANNEMVIKGCEVEQPIDNIKTNELVLMEFDEIEPQGICNRAVDVRLLSAAEVECAESITTNADSLQMNTESREVNKMMSSLSDIVSQKNIQVPRLALSQHWTETQFTNVSNMYPAAIISSIDNEPFVDNTRLDMQIMQIPVETIQVNADSKLKDVPENFPIEIDQISQSIFEAQKSSDKVLEHVPLLALTLNKSEAFEEMYINKFSDTNKINVRNAINEIAAPFVDEVMTYSVEAGKVAAPVVDEGMTEAVNGSSVETLVVEEIITYAVEVSKVAAPVVDEVMADAGESSTVAALVVDEVITYNPSTIKYIASEIIPQRMDHSLEVQNTLSDRIKESSVLSSVGEMVLCSTDTNIGVGEGNTVILDAAGTVLSINASEREINKEPDESVKSYRPATDEFSSDMVGIDLKLEQVNNTSTNLYNSAPDNGSLSLDADINKIESTGRGIDHLPAFIAVDLNPASTTSISAMFYEDVQQITQTLPDVQHISPIVIEEANLAPPAVALETNDLDRHWTMAETLHDLQTAPSAEGYTTVCPEICITQITTLRNDEASAIPELYEATNNSETAEIPRASCAIDECTVAAKSECIDISTNEDKTCIRSSSFEIGPSWSLTEAELDHIPAPTPNSDAGPMIFGRPLEINNDLIKINTLPEPGSSTSYSMNPDMKCVIEQSQVPASDSDKRKLTVIELKTSSEDEEADCFIFLPAVEAVHTDNVITSDTVAVCETVHDNMNVGETDKIIRIDVSSELKYCDISPASPTIPSDIETSASNIKIDSDSSVLEKWVVQEIESGIEKRDIDELAIIDIDSD